ncbi:hypothetical protein BD289DRAFT_440977 [Coniella lustricola]|uniref:Uncharacterized protein n=1 Tax=Coniella lustricola TaxID=2025994 RepID=A0A2T3A018_9PEZI|nr:hypothetical protein BD289DRAFT_440977 [Coniella lustricola]
MQTCPEAVGYNSGSYMLAALKLSFGIARGATQYHGKYHVPPILCFMNLSILLILAKSC